MSAAGQAMVVHLQWSYWCPCHPRLSYQKPQHPNYDGIPEIPGICVIARQDRPGEAFQIFHVQATYNLAQAFESLLTAGSPIYRQLQGERCFMRWAPVAQRNVRDQLLAAIQYWMAAGAPAAAKPALIEELLVPEILDRQKG